MNIRRTIDYSNMYAAIDMAMAAEKLQIELYYEIGRVVSQRSEKGAAVMAAEYLTKQYPNVSGFSPRNLRRMRDFYRTYENNPAVLSLAMQIGWTQNVVIMEANLPVDLCAWYLKAVKRFGWSKVELIDKISENAHKEIILTIEDNVCCSMEQKNEPACGGDQRAVGVNNKIRYLIQRYRCRHRPKEGGRRRWCNTLCLILMEKRTAFMRC